MRAEALDIEAGVAASEGPARRAARRLHLPPLQRWLRGLCHAEARVLSREELEAHLDDCENPPHASEPAAQQRLREAARVLLFATLTRLLFLFRLRAACAAGPVPGAGAGADVCAARRRRRRRGRGAQAARGRSLVRHRAAAAERGRGHGGRAGHAAGGRACGPGQGAALCWLARVAPRVQPVGGGARPGPAGHAIRRLPLLHPRHLLAPAVARPRRQDAVHPHQPRPEHDQTRCSGCSGAPRRRLRHQHAHPVPRESRRRGGGRGCGGGCAVQRAGDAAPLGRGSLPLLRRCCCRRRGGAGARHLGAGIRRSGFLYVLEAPGWLIRRRR